MKVSYEITLETEIFKEPDTLTELLLQVMTEEGLKVEELKPLWNKP